MSRAIRELKKSQEVRRATAEEITIRERDALAKPPLVAQKQEWGSGSFREGGIHDSGRCYFSKR